MATVVIGLRQVQRLTGLTRGYLEYLEAQGDFPKRLDLHISTSGRRLAFWRESAVIRWLDAERRAFEEQEAIARGDSIKAGASHE